MRLCLVCACQGVWVKSQLDNSQYFKGTVSRGWDRLLVVWMDRALYGDESLIVLEIYLLLLGNFVFYFLQRCWKKVAAYMLLGQPSWKCVRCCWQLSGKFVIAGQRVLATLWQIPERVLATCANTYYIYLWGLSIPSDPLPEVILITLQSSWQSVWDNH
jgi:hypothetical protein